MNLPNAIALTIKGFVKLSYFTLFTSHHDVESGRPGGPEGAKGARGPGRPGGQDDQRALREPGGQGAKGQVASKVVMAFCWS